MFARSLNPFSDYSKTESIPPSDIAKRLQFIQNILFPAVGERSLNHASLAIAKFHRRFKISPDPFPDGCLVMVKDPTHSTSLQPYYEGPYKVLRRNRGGSYLLLDHDSSLLKPPAAPSQLKLVSRDPIHDVESFVVDHIIQHCGGPTRREYFLVKWKHLDSSHNSWEPAFNLTIFPSLLKTGILYLLPIPIVLHASHVHNGGGQCRSQLPFPVIFSKYSVPISFSF